MSNASAQGLTSAGIGVSLDNPIFREAVRNIFNDELKTLAQMLAATQGSSVDVGAYDDVESITTVAERLAASERMNEVLWGFPHFDFVQKPLDTYEQNVRYLQDWLCQRMAWLEGYLNSNAWA